MYSYTRVRVYTCRQRAPAPYKLHLGCPRRAVAPNCQEQAAAKADAVQVSAGENSGSSDPRKEEDKPAKAPEGEKAGGQATKKGRKQQSSATFATITPKDEDLSRLGVVQREGVDLSSRLLQVGLL